ncbi:GntR family transcriptional regulator [Heyndrickxia oleronia]|uniref:GntR family transcriptional regulator n=1 Tax=Heyndrickxia oleronia TaxID=38875 RepID=UPI0009031CB5|nr:GntR family transcriptional regulator [Heyndrickxia oleronia]OJH20688.1 GntR family transcriptional regulator [Bacillus obstructivus]
MINKESPIPIYYQIQEHIRKNIKQQKWKKGEAIPSERILTEQFEVSRMTIRQAVQGLVDEGILTRKRGSGTYVSNEKVEQPLKVITSFTKLMEQRGKKAASNITDFYIRKPTETEAHQLNIDADTDVYHIERIRLGDEIPIAIETSIVPVKLAEGLTKEDIQHSLYEFIEVKKGYPLGDAKQSIEAIAANKQTASQLDIPVDSPILQIERVAYLKNGVPLEYVRSQYAGSRFKFYL